MLAGVLLAISSPAMAPVIELKDVAADRIERQRAWAQGALPLSGTPDLQHLDDRLAAQGLAKGSPVFIRIFKAESELELWMRKGASFVLLDTYPICHWTGSLGPKLREGDRQSPEGFYSVAMRQTRHRGRWRRALNLGFPNALDRRLQRTGSYILLHGGCSSTGCFAMTDPVLDEIHALALAALRGGQDRIQVHIFPFRMTGAAFDRHKDHPWGAFWKDLKAGYDAFQRTRMPPHISICDRRYLVEDAQPGEPGDPRPLALAHRASGARDAGRCGARIARQAHGANSSGAARAE